MSVLNPYDDDVYPGEFMDRLIEDGETVTRTADYDEHVDVTQAGAIGAEVTVLSHSLSEAEGGRRFGAHLHHTTSDTTWNRYAPGDHDR